jgi:hypothetical protein
MERRINHIEEEADGRYNATRLQLQLHALHTDTKSSGVEHTLYNDPTKQLVLPNILLEWWNQGAYLPMPSYGLLQMSSKRKPCSSWLFSYTVIYLPLTDTKKAILIFSYDTRFDHFNYLDSIKYIHI